MFKVGDKVVAIDRKTHEIEPHCYPAVGTIGVLVKQVGEQHWRVKWADGSTSEDDVWGCYEDGFELYTKPKEMTVHEYQTELLRMMDANGRKKGFCIGVLCTAKCPLYSICRPSYSIGAALCNPKTVEIVQQWAAEHPEQKPISASDYEKLKAVHILYGDCFIAKDKCGLCAVYCDKPTKKKENDFWSDDGSGMATQFELDCLSWEDNKPLHLTPVWLEEVAHDV